MIVSRRWSPAFATSALSLSLRPTLSTEQLSYRLTSGTYNYFESTSLSSTRSTAVLPRHRSSFYSSPIDATRCLKSTGKIGGAATMVATANAPGILDTDSSGGVLLYPRDGGVNVSYGPSLSDYNGELLVIALWAPEEDEAELEFPQAVREFDEKVAGGALSEMATDAEFKAKANSSTDVARLVGAPSKRIILFGLGKRSSKTAPAAHGAGRLAVQKGMPIKACTSVGLYIDEASAIDVAAATEGAVAGAYVDERYKEKKDSGKMPSEIVLLGVSKSSEFDESIKKGTAVALGVITTKEVVNAPANCLTPATLATAAETVAQETGLDVKICGRSECEKLGMGLYLGVGRGSTDEPKFIHMTYKPDGPSKKKVCIVGKAVTFDTGGTNLKTGAGSMIELMKFDMGGAAVALGTAKVIGMLKPKDVEVHFIMPAVENMIGDRAIHPGDILKSSNGKTVEVINTDAEGRLCLADALVYAEELGDVDYIVDIATLTGAIIVSLGNDVAGMWSPSDEFADVLLNASKLCGEAMWRMPLVNDYKEGLKSKIADLRNIGAGRAAGSITAALFLKEFVKTNNWAHLDIAGTVYSDKKGGATGYGVKTMVHWIHMLSAQE